MNPQDSVAANFMTDKGYRRLKPKSIEQLEGKPCWYYVYELPDGTLELEVSWENDQWQSLVTTFQPKK